MEIQNEQITGSSPKTRRGPFLWENKPYRSLQQISNIAGVNYQNLCTLVNAGFSPDEAVLQLRKKRYEYNGKYYASKREIAEDLGVSPRVFEQSSAFAEIRKAVCPSCNPFEFNGVWYESKAAFYKKLGISGSGIRKYAIRHNISTEEAMEIIANQKLKNLEE